MLVSELVNVFDFWEELRKLCWNLLIPFRVKIRKPSRQRRKLRRLMLILLWRLGREQYLFKENYMKAIKIKIPRNHLRLQKYLSLWYVKPTALLSFPSNPLVPLLKHLWSLLSAVLVAILWTKFTEPGSLNTEVKSSYSLKIGIFLDVFDIFGLSSSEHSLKSFILDQSYF